MTVQIITNHGPCDLKVTDTKGIVWTVSPNETARIEAVRIFHGNSRAHYTVEPADEKATR